MVFDDDLLTPKRLRKDKSELSSTTSAQAPLVHASFLAVAETATTAKARAVKRAIES